jgi:hypothetical protein
MHTKKKTTTYHFPDSESMFKQIKSCFLTQNLKKSSYYLDLGKTNLAKKKHLN